MKKLFTIFSVLLFAGAVNADIISISPTSPKSGDNLRQALEKAASGDVIVMASGTYEESNSNYIAVTNKNVTIKADAGANPIVQPRVPMRIKGGSRVEIIGVKFDASHIEDGHHDDYQHIIQTADNSDGNKLILKECEFYNFTYYDYEKILVDEVWTGEYEETLQGNSAIYCSSSNKLDSCIVKDCKFHDITGGCMQFENTGMIGLVVTNSTFANIPYGPEYSKGVIQTASTSGKVEFDHCTFYDCTTKDANYNVIQVTTTPNTTVSNCIFMQASLFNCCATQIPDGGTVTNCLTYNFDNWQGKSGHAGHVYNGSYTPTITNCFTGDPLFTNTASGDFTYAGNWTTGSVSPARRAGTDGSDLGDPRWYTAEVLPETDFASPYNLSGAVAQLTGNVWYDSEHAEIYYNDKSENGTAKWKIHATRACSVSASYHNGYHSGHILTIEIRDAENNLVGSIADGTTRYDVQDYPMSGSICLPEAGDYTIMLSNATAHSSARISNLELALVSEEVTVGSTGWATFCSDNALNFFGSDVEAYIVTGHSGYMLEKTRLNSTIPANTPLLLKADAGSYIIPMVSSSETSTTGNKLVRGTGSGVGYEEGKTRYVLMANGSTAEFQLLADGGASANVGTNKAYLEFNEVISLAPSALRLENEENNATSIEEVNSSDDAFKFVENGKLFIKKNGVVYDMMGRAIR